MPKPRQNSIAREIDDLRKSFRTLDRSLGRLGPMLASASSLGNGSQDSAGSARPRLSAKQRAALKLQGRYMGYMRQLKPRQKTLVRQIREAKGVEAAIARARNLSQA